MASLESDLLYIILKQLAIGVYAQSTNEIEAKT